MAHTNKPLVTQAEYIERCLSLCTNSAWLSQYRQTAPKERPAMLRTLTTRLQTTATLAATLAATRPQDILLSATDQERREAFWRGMRSRGRKVYLNEEKSVEIPHKKVKTTRRVFEGAPYLLSDEESEEWIEFCSVKATYKESLDRKLEAAEQTLEALRLLCEKRGTSTRSTEELKRLRKQRGGTKRIGKDIRKRNEGGASKNNRGRMQSAARKRKRTLPRALVGGAFFAGGLVCGVLGVAASSTALKMARG